MSDTSQYQEATFILKHFAGRIGRFLDIGAFDGVTLSNTRPLADLGWSGVCVEPSPPAFCYLMKNYAGNPRVELVNAAVVDAHIDSWTGRLRKLHCNTVDSLSADTMSTFESKLRDRWASEGYPFRNIWTPVITWIELLSGFTGLIEFVNIDVEGMNFEVFQAMPIWPEMVCVERDPLNMLELVAKLYPHTEVIGGNVLGWK